MNAYTSMKDAFAAIVLVATAASGQPALAQTAPVESPTVFMTIQPEMLPAVEEVQPTVQDVLLAVCESRGYGEACAKHLLGMVWNESNNISTAIGDHGKARGYFQIWTGLHKIKVSCAEDLVCSANWTLDYMERNAYPKYVKYAIQCHNGCNIENGYAAKALRNGERLWNQPLEVSQAAPIVLPAIEIAAAK